MSSSALLLCAVTFLVVVDLNNNQVNASLSWPSFLGGGTSPPTTNQPVAPDQEQPAATPPTYLLSPQYPIWRVHQYNGIHLKPVAVSQLPASSVRISAPDVFPSHPTAEFDVEGTAVQDLQTNDIDPRHPGGSFPIVLAEEDSDDLPAELVEMATSLGVTDMSKLPTLNEAMSLLGTTSAAETVTVIRDIASTENGQALIRQFLENSDDELASSEEEDISGGGQQASVLDAEAAAAEQEPQESVVVNERRGFLGETLDRAHSNLEVFQRIVTQAPPTEEPSSSAAGGIFSIITNFFRPAPPTVPLDSLTESPTTPQPLPSSPLFNPQASDYDRVVRQYYGRPSGQLRDSFTASFPTLVLPRLPNVHQTPSLPTNFQNLPNIPQLPNIRIPTQQSPSAYSPAQPGTYIRVRYPLAAFQPATQPQPQAQIPRNRISSSTPAVRAVVQSAIAAPMSINNEPMVFELPHVHPNQIVQEQPQQQQRSRTPASTYSDISQLPLSVENRNAFRNAPHVVTSYGTPALPFTFDDEDNDTEAEPQSAASNQVPIVVRPEEDSSLDTQSSPSSPSTSAKTTIAQEGTTTDEETVGDDGATATNQVAAQRRSASVGPQRITAYDVVATGRLGRRANAAAIEAAIPTQKSPVIDYGE